MISNPDFSETCFVVTGACGFFGRSLIPQLIHKKAHVIGLDKELGRPPPHHPSLILLEGSFEDLQNQIETQVRSFKNRVFIHLAGLSDATICQQNPDLAQSSNVELTQLTLQFCATTGIDHYLFASTGMVYGTDSPRPYNEQDLPRPPHVYAQTKLAAEKLIQAQAKNYIIVRMSNIYGPESSPNTVVGHILTQVRQKKNLVMKSLAPVRDFIFIDDVTRGLCLLLDLLSGGASSVVNLSSGQGTSIRELAEAACEIAGITEAVRQENPGEQLVTKHVLDNRLLQILTNFKPSLSIQEGLRRIFS